MNKTLKRIDYSNKFLKQIKKIPTPIQVAFRNRFVVFLEDPFRPMLNNHALTGKYLGKRSINITGDWRAVYSETLGDDGEKVMTFHLLGTHSQLYK